MVTKISSWWDSHTLHSYGKVTLVVSETSLLWGFVKLQRYRAYPTSDVDSVTADTPFRTWRVLTLGPLKLPFLLPKFVEDRCE